MPHAQASGFPPRFLDNRSAGARPPRFFCCLDNRSAGACPPRCLRAIAAWRGTGPRPTVKKNARITVARGPVPRDLSK